jgi:L-alanine-DL-glutamate epimerase-like enolase superfamily enzyme
LIDRVEVVNGAIPISPTEPPQQWLEEWSSQLYVKVTASGQIGWGEVLPAGGSSREPYASLVKRLGEFLRGTDEEDIARAWESMRKLTFSGGYGITTGAISGIDIALWDIDARKAGTSLAHSLGGAPKRVKRYGSLSRYKTNEQAVKVVGTLLDRGFETIKLHQAGRDSEGAIRAARKEYGRGFELAADLNCAFSPGAAKEFAKRVAPYDLLWVEEPVWPPDDFESLAELNGLVPVAAGENAFSVLEFKRMIEHKAVTFLQPDITKMGGLTPALEVLGLASEAGVKLAFHSRPGNGWLGTIASAHLAAAVSPDALIESPPNDVPMEYFQFTGSMDAKSITPAGPGIGIHPKDDIPVSVDSKMLMFHEVQ